MNRRDVLSALAGAAVAATTKGQTNSTNGMIYREGKAIRRVSEEEIVPALLEEIDRFVADKTAGVPSTAPILEEAPARDNNPLVVLR